jgi:CubicO group peptidase (beta-lactamase class C family)
MIRRASLTCSVLFLLAATGASSQTGPAPRNTLPTALTRFNDFYTTSLQQHAIVGSSLFVVHDGQVVFKSFNGMTNPDTGQKVDEDTIYHWASITKTFTGIAVLQLRDRGLLNLHDPVVDHLPELRQVHNPYGSLRDITIQHLLTHTAGFRNPTWPWGGDKPWHPHEPQHWQQLVSMLPYTETLFKPGTRYSYSNLGIIFLGRIIEQLTTDDYEVYIDKNILKPLKMHRSYFDGTPYHLLKYRSASYFVKDGIRRPARFDVNTGITVSNGGLNAPLGDMAKYLNFLIGNTLSPSQDRGKAQERRALYDGILKRSSVEEMFTPRVDVSRTAARTVSMGLTFFVEDQGGLRLIGHSGGQNAFISHIYINPARHAGYVVAYNTEAETADKVGKGNTRVLDAAIRDHLVEHVFPLFVVKSDADTN